MNHGIDISVIVCTYNRAALLYRSVESLFSLRTDTAFGFEILVVDDASTDDTPAILAGLQRRSPVPLRWTRATGAGIAAARNLGLREARGECVAFFDDDQIADPDWLLELWLTRISTGADCVGGARVLDLPSREIAALPKIFRLYLGEIPVEHAARSCGRGDLLCTGAVLLNRAVFGKVGVFDESLSEGGEDTEFFMRVRASGLRAWYTPHSVVRHIIPSYRLQAPYLQWAAVRGGECFACRDLREFGRIRSLTTAVLRVGHAIAFHAPMMIARRLFAQESHALAHRCQIQRALAYARSLYRRIASARGDRRASATVNFRNERSLFPGTES